MSSFLSANYTPVTIESTNNVPLMAKVLSIKQGKYDANKAEIEQQMALYNNNLKGLRDSDNQYIASRLKEAEGVINGYGNKDYSITATKDTLLGNLKSITEDPIVKSAVLNRAKYDQANAQVAEKKKKNDGSYSDVNYQDMLDQGGYNAYMKGETKDLGELRYNDYVDVRAEKSKVTSEYVTKMLLTPQYLGTDQSNPAFYKDSYGNKVEKETVEKFVDSQLSQKDLTQLQIEARQTIGKWDDAKFNTYVGEYYVNKSISDGERLAEAEAFVRNNPDKKEVYGVGINAAKLQIAADAKKIAAGTYSRDEMYDVYKNQFVKTIAAPYELDRVTKIERDKLPFEVMDADRKYDLDLRKTLAAEQANKIASGAVEGTATTVPTTGSDKPTSDFKDIQVATYKSSQALDTYLKAQNIDGYNNKSPNEQWTYMLNLKATDSRTLGNNATLLNLTKDFQYAQKGYANIVNNKNEEFKQVVAEKYNDMIGGSINLNNLATTAPLTASLIRGGKKYENLSNAEKTGLNAEFASQAIQFGDVPDDVKEVYKKIIVKNKGELKNNPQILKTIQNSTPTESQPGFFGSIWGVAKGVAGLGADVAQESTRGLVDAFNYATQGVGYADEQRAIFDAQQDKDYSENWRNLKNAGKVYDYISPVSQMRDLIHGQDSNIMQLQSGDLNTKQGVKTAVAQSFYNFNDKVNNDIKTEAATYQESLRGNKAFTFSTASKTQAPTAIEIENAIAASKTPDGNSNPIPTNDNNYTIYREGDGFKVKYKTGSGKDTTYAEAYLQNLPDSVVQKYDLTKQNWINSPLNPKVELDPKEVDMYTDANKRSQDVDIMYKNGVLTTNMQNVLYTNPANTPFATTDELVDKIKTERGEDFYNRNKQNIDAILLDNYTAIPFVNPATGTFQFKLNYAGNRNSPAIELGSTKDEHQWDLTYRAESLRLKLSQIYSLK